jgi:hypothetical protein
MRPFNNKEVVQYFKKSIYSSLADAQLRYGLRLWKSYGVERNVEAIKYYDEQ